MRYEMTKPHHHHFKCRTCDGVFEIAGCPGDLKKLAAARLSRRQPRFDLFRPLPEPVLEKTELEGKP